MRVNIAEGQAASVLVLEDEAVLREAMVEFLTLHGCSTVGAGTLKEADAALAARDVDVIVLDRGLPDGDGIAWLETQRFTRTPGVIVVTARGAREERIAGVDAGADVYLVKPVALEELALSVRNLLRRLRPDERSEIGAAPAAPNETWLLHLRDWTLRAPSGRQTRLTHLERAFLEGVTGTPGAPVARAALVSALGHDPSHYDPRRMEVLVRRLRRKVEQALGTELPVETVHGRGYAFIAPVRQVPGDEPASC